jgi:hypothetical protein
MFWKVVAFVAGISVLFAACGQKPDVSPLVTPQPVEAVAQVAAPVAKPPLSIGPIHAGMTVAALEALGLPFSTKAESSYGSDYVVYLIEIGGGVEVSTWIVDGLSADVSTASAEYVTATGAHVGDTVARLRELYPAGEIARGYESEVGLYYSFSTGGGEYFRFDAEALGEDCVVKDIGCPADMSAIRSILLDVY